MNVLRNEAIILEDTYWIVGHGPATPELTDDARFWIEPQNICIFWNNTFAEKKDVSWWRRLLRAIAEAQRGARGETTQAGKEVRSP